MEKSNKVVQQKITLISAHDRGNWSVSGIMIQGVIDNNVMEYLGPEGIQAVELAVN